jgi:hypothetical protein
MTKRAKEFFIRHQASVGVGMTVIAFALGYLLHPS